VRHQKHTESTSLVTDRLRLRDVTFDEDATFNRSRHNHSDEVHDEEPEAPRVADTNACDDVVLEDHDMEEPQRPADSSRVMNTKKRRPACA
jgi:hypothetical protein